MKSVALAIDRIKNLQAPEAMLLGQGHRADLVLNSQPGAPAAAARPDHPAARMGAHPHPET
jgi:hypothetical protein